MATVGSAASTPGKPTLPSQRREFRSAASPGTFATDDPKKADAHSAAARALVCGTKPTSNLGHRDVDSGRNAEMDLRSDTNQAYRWVPWPKRFIGGYRMSNWAERASAALLPGSITPTLAAAIREWFYTGNFLDLETNDGVCELCGQQDLRYHFEIENRETQAYLMVGSECIKRFDIGGVDEMGNRLDSATTTKLVDRHRRGLVENARKQRVMTALLKLGQAAPDFDAMSFIDFVDDKGAFTPNQVAMIFWKLDTFRVKYRPTDWKVRMKRDSDIGQLRGMKPAAFKRVYAALSGAQQQRVLAIEARFASFGQKWR